MTSKIILFLALVALSPAAARRSDSTTVPSRSNQDGVIHYNLKRSPKADPQRMRADRRRQLSGDSSSAELTNVGRDTFYTVQVDIGTPPQSFDLAIETTSVLFWVGDDGCSSCDANHLFNSDASSTYNDTHRYASEKYGEGSITGSYAFETVAIGEQRVEDAEIILAKIVPKVIITTRDVQAPKLSGGLGLGRPANTSTASSLANTSSSSSSGNPLWTRFLSESKNKEFGIYLARDNSTLFLPDGPLPSMDKGGQLTFGGVDSSKFQGELNYVDAVPLPKGGFWNNGLNSLSVGLNVWVVSIDGLTVNGKSVNNSESRAAIAIGSSMTFGPPEAVADFYSHIDGSEKISGALWTFPCKAMESFQATLNLGGNQYDIHPKDLISGRVNDGTHCLGTVQPLASKASDGPWVIGTNFLINVYTAFRLDTPAVGFAPVADSANFKYTGSYEHSSARLSVGISATAILIAAFTVLSVAF